MFCGGDASAPGHLARCDGRQGHVDASLDDGDHADPDPPPPHGKTRTTEEAMRVLRRHRRALIERARRIAHDLCEEFGTTHSRAVRDRMEMLGELPGTSEFWLGAVFRHPDFAPTGAWHTYTDHARNIHERRIRIWRIAP